MKMMKTFDIHHSSLDISWPALLLTATLIHSDEPSLREVIRRAGDYVTRSHAAMTSVIAEERYVQKVQVQPAMQGRGVQPAMLTEQRTLVSDFIIIAGGGRGPRWMAFRDVLEVDGTPVRERDDRLQKLFSSGDDPLDRAVAVSNESARYNIGPEGFVRTINVPIIAIDFLLPETTGRFSFHRKNAATDPVWEIEFVEKDRPTVIRTPEGRSVQSRGSFRIDSRDGRVLESTLELLDRRARITVFYEIENRLGVAVPVAMRERYLLGREQVEGEATYSKYRRFETGARIIPK
jgi:hypothetical protein